MADGGERTLGSGTEADQSVPSGDRNRRSDEQPATPPTRAVPAAARNARRDGESESASEFAGESAEA
ncbi:hypothetical protein AUR65_017150 [Haloferax marisrubri]|uniref:Uncharacterized protein n=1 Tax=Haloferax marisrubri TaxID=1544719 RepID=A0A2P4NML1_9EURY|nr:hypothetical protein AUR65_017150 [Haloferax marisrubri]